MTAGADHEATDAWGSRLGFLFAAVGSAVGIGNIWRFSAVLGQNGGGAYLVPYLIAVAAFGIPLMVIELAVGRRLRANVVTAFRLVAPRLEPVGWLIATIVFTILSYYLVITGWTLAYFATSAAGRSLAFSDFTGGLAPLATFAISALITGVVVSLGVRAGIERLASTLMPASFLILGALLIRSLTLDGFGEGFRFMFTPDFTVLTDARVLSAAFGQAFFSLSVGFGVLLTYGAYLDRKVDIVRSAVVITVADLTVALMAGLVIFPLVFTFGLQPTAGAELAFTTLPTAFEQMPGGRLLGPAFFALLFFAALTSAVSMLEVNVSAIAERTRLTRRRATVVLTLIVLALGLPSALSYSAVDLRLFDWRIQDLLDDTVGTLGLPVAALLIAVIFTRRLARAAIEEEIGVQAGREWRRVILPAVRYVIPAVLVAVTLARLVLDVDTTGWHFLPGIPEIPGPGQFALTVLLLVALVPATLTVVRLLQRWRARRSTGP